MIGKVFRIKSTAALGKHVAVEGILNIDTTKGGYLYLDGSLMSGTEIAYLDGVTAGTALASKALVLGSSKEIATITTATITTTNVTTANDTNIVLGQRMSTSSAAGASIDIDATNDAYAEGMELRWHVADWADGETTHTDAKGMYLRMENRESNSNGSIYGCEVYGVTNNVANTKYVWGGLFYAYVKGAAGVTATGIYAIQPEITFDAETASSTITEAAVVRAKITGGTMADYTTMHGYKLLAGDMNGGSRTYGNAIWVEDDSAMSGTCGWTKGLYLAATCTTAIDIDSCTTAIDFAASGTGITGTVSTLNATTGRALKLDGTVAAPTHADGYGVVEINANFSGSVGGPYACASSTWINFAAGAVPGGIVTVRNDGIYIPTGITSTAAKMVIGGRMHYMADDGANPGSLYLFSTNIYANALTAIFDVNAIEDFANTSVKSSGGIAIPFIKCVNSGTTYYINLYTS